jgi:hypothetical protein
MVASKERADAKWENDGEKEKYPSLYLLSKMTEQMYEAMGVPKEVLCNY